MQQEQQWQTLINEAAILDGGSTAGISNPPALPEPPKPIDTKKELVMLFKPMFDIIAPGWEVTPDEIDMLAESYADVLNKYFPGGISLGVEINALFCTAIIFGPRMGKPRKIKQTAPQQPSAQVQPGQTPSPAAPQSKPAKSESSRES